MVNPDDRRDIQEVLASIVSEARVGPNALASETGKAAAEPEREYKKGEVITPQGSGRGEETKSRTRFAASTESQGGRAPAGSSHLPRDGDRHLMSPESDRAVHDAFSRLAETILPQNPRTLDDLIVEMLQPMLTSWFDEHLPALVERLVQEEIRRVSGGRR